jgi:DNA-directed RNA polymerase specialized sigma subunit
MQKVEGLKPAKAIVAEVAALHGVSVDEIMGKSRQTELTLARHEAIRAVRKATGYSTLILGSLFNRNHTTILYALKALNGERKQPRTEARVEKRDRRRKALDLKRIKVAQKKQEWANRRAAIVALVDGGLTQTEVASRFGVSRARVSWLCNNRDAA